MRKLFALGCCTGILLASFRASHSTSGFLVMGLGGTLLLDRFLLRWIAWPPFSWRTELGICGGFFLLGAVGFHLMRPGIVPWWEALYRGWVVVLIAFLLNALVGAVCGFQATWRKTLALRAVLGGLLVLLIPLVAALHPLHTVPKRSPAALGLDFEDVRFRTADGVELAAWLVPHPQARGNVIFCHGHGRNRGHVAGLLPTLHDLGLNVLAFDFRGHGDSDGHTSTFGHREVRDLLAAERYLSGRFPGQPVFLVGISLGASVSLQALPSLPGVRGVWSEGAFARFGDVLDHYFDWVPGPLRRPQLRLYEWLGWLDCGFWAAAIKPVDCLSQARAPIYFCHAQEDELIPLAEHFALYESYVGVKTCWRVAHASHYNVRQRNREEYLQRLRAFLQECLVEQ